uniref:Transmembrane protein 150B n=1 Tax=Oryzias latipes TaxID=8090 RepID=A0A3B3H4S6_ORYLA
MWLLALVPICLAVFGSTGIWTVFAVSVMNNSVNLTHIFPYISDCAWYPPQKCLFTQICGLIIITALWIGMIQFQQVKQLGNHGRVNNASAVMGFLSCGGLSVCSNTQVSEFHLVGALVSFVSALAYFWMQVYLTYQGQSFPERSWMGPLRALFCTIATLLGIACILSRGRIKMAGMRAATFSLTFSKAIGFYATNCDSGVAVCEFALVMVIFFLFALFAVEFRHIECRILIMKKHILKDEKSLESVKVNVSVVELFK